MKISYFLKTLLILVFALMAFFISSCSSSGGGGSGPTTPTYTIGGTASGLNSGTQVVLADTLNNVTKHTLIVNANGAFQFNSTLNAGSSYNVVVSIQPTGEVCTVNNNQGINLSQNITNINVVCSVSENTFTLGGSVNGLAANAEVTLVNNGDLKDALILKADGNFTFATPIAYGGSYNVTVATQPTGEVCTVNNYQGINVNQNISNLNVVCNTISNSYTVGGTVSGLVAGESVTLVNNGNILHTVTVAANTSFTFPISVAATGNYTVTVETNPANETCTVNNGIGLNINQNITNITVVCSTTSYTIGGTLTGLDSGESVTLINNGNLKSALVLTAYGSFSFLTPVAYGSSYNVTVETQPNGEICSVNYGQGAGVSKNITTVKVVCNNSTYTIGGTVRGLTSGENVTLINNGDTKNPAIESANGSFTFSATVAFGGSYNVTVETNPVNEICTVGNASGSSVDQDITTVTVTCSAATYTVGGTVTGLTAGESVILVNNNDNKGESTVSQDGGFTFSTPIAYQSGYDVTVLTQPVDETCSVTNGSGSSVNANVTNVGVTCSTNIYTVTVNVSGLATGQEFKLLNNNDQSDQINVDSNTTYTFKRKIPANGSFYITLVDEPTDILCSVVPQQGQNVTADVTIAMQCVSTSSMTYANFPIQQDGLTGANPEASLTLGPDGNLYGTTYNGGANSTGLVFRITTAGIESVIYNFGSTTNDGANPKANLVFNSSDSKFYGTTYNGGTNNKGTVFSITTAGVESVIYNFGSKINDGANPMAGLVIGSDGNFYGTTAFGGNDSAGIVFKVTSSGSETILHYFGVNGDGVSPQAALTLGNDGKFYGTTFNGGAKSQGSVFSITLAGAESVIYSLGTNSRDGANPQASLVLANNGYFYGTTPSNGANSQGIVFRVSSSGLEKVLYSFGNTATDGTRPRANLLAGSDGNLYGTTYSGGSNDTGTIFKIMTTGVETVLYSFGATNNDGANPQAGLTIGSDFNFYGTTKYGSNNNAGSVFKLSF